MRDSSSSRRKVARCGADERREGGDSLQKRIMSDPPRMRVGIVAPSEGLGERYLPGCPFPEPSHAVPSVPAGLSATRGQRVTGRVDTPRGAVVDWWSGSISPTSTP